MREGWRWGGGRGTIMRVGREEGEAGRGYMTIFIPGSYTGTRTMARRI